MPDDVTANEAARELLGYALFPTENSPATTYLLVDAARDSAIYSRLRDFAATEEIVPLYQGDAAEEMAAVAPYLVRLEGVGSPVLSWLWYEGWGRAWGIFLRGPTEIESVRGHLRRLTNARVEGGDVVLFRFYDPRVASVFLSTCDAEQASTFFGPLESVLMESADGTTLEEFTPADGEVLIFRSALFD